MYSTRTKLITFPIGMCYTHTDTHTRGVCIYRYRIHTCKYPLRRERKSFRKTMFIVKAMLRNAPQLLLLLCSSFFFFLLLLFLLDLRTTIVVAHCVCFFLFFKGEFFFFCFAFFNLKTDNTFGNFSYYNILNLYIFANIFLASSLSTFIFQNECATQKRDKLPNVRYYIPLYAYIYIVTNDIPIARYIYILYILHI